jgi:hypothetical protein
VDRVDRVEIIFGCFAVSKRSGSGSSMVLVRAAGEANGEIGCGWMAKH